MKRRENKTPLQYKKRKINKESIFPKDLCFNICQFLDSWFVLRVARVISVDWLHASELLDYDLDFEKLEDMAFDGEECRSALENIFENQVLLHRLTSLKLHNCNLGDGIEIFSNLKESNEGRLFSKLTALNLCKNELSDENMKEFCKLIDENFMCNLTDLDISFNSFTNLESIPNNDFLRRNLKKMKLISAHCDPCDVLSRMEGLTYLNIEHCNVEEGSLKKLIANENMKHLSSLKMADYFDEPIDELLVKNQSISNITKLSVNNCSMDMGGRYFKHPKFFNLKLLDISGAVICNIDQLEHLTKLEKLIMSACGITDRDVELLCRGKFNNSLKHLDLSYNEKLTDSSIDIITSTFSNLSFLLLYGIDKFTIESTKKITGRLNNLTGIEISGKNQQMSYQYFTSPNMKTLKSLKLFGHPIGDDGFRALVKCPTLSNLEHLWLAKANISNNSLILLTSNECQLRKLKVLDLRDNEKVDIDVCLGEEWIQNEEEEELEDMTLRYVITRNIPTLQQFNARIY